MKPLATALAIASAAIGARAADTARWVMSFPSPTNNAAEFEARFGGVTFTNADLGRCPACGSQLYSTKDSTGSFARWKYTNPSAAATSNQDIGGILLPLDPNWSWNHDLRTVSAIRIKARSASFGQFRLALESPATPFGSVGIQPEMSFSAGPAWRWISVRPSRMTMNLGLVNRDTVRFTLSVADSMGRIQVLSADYIDQDRINAGAYDTTDLRAGDTAMFNSDSNNVLKHVRALKFIPDAYRRVGAATLDIDSIVLIGVAPQWGRIRGSNACQGNSIVIDRFDENRPSSTRNLLGGAWETTLDSSTSHPNGQATGNSSLAPLPYGAWAPLYGAMLEARLDRMDPLMHPAGGWARLTTWLDRSKSPRSFPDLKAISFRAQAGRLDTLFDTTRIHGVTLRLHSSAVDDSVAYSVRIPYDKIRPVAGDSGRTVCIDLDELRQAGWYTGKAGIHAIDPSTLTAVSWTLSLDEPSASNASASRLSIWEAKFWTSGTSGLSRIVHPVGLDVRPVGGSLLVTAPYGRNLRVEFRDLSGRMLASRSMVATGTDQRLDLPSEDGLLLVSVTDGSTRRDLRVFSR